MDDSLFVQQADALIGHVDDCDVRHVDEPKFTRLLPLKSG